jgi:NAD-dependent DNA ligase
MGSLDKVKAEDGGEKALRRWAEDGGGRGGESYVLSDKLDGVSALLVIDAKEVSTTPRLYTRGDGKVGRDISHIVPHVSGVLPPPPPPPPPAKKKSSVASSTFAVRGELVIPRREFDAHLRGTRGVNARNLVSGVVNAKTPDPDVLRFIRFVPYALLDPPGLPQAQQLRHLIEVTGYPASQVVVHKTVDEVSVPTLLAYLAERRKDGEFEIDGIVVVKGSNKDKGKKEKDERANPRDAVAFKSRAIDNVADTVVSRVVWAVSKDGLLKPVVEFAPVDLSGATLRRATGFNAEFVHKNRLGPGAVVRVTRSGDVIPHILEVLSPATSIDSAAQMPDPEDTGLWEWTSNGKDVRVVMTTNASSSSSSSSSADLNVRLLTHFVTKLGVAGVSASTVRKMYDAGLDTPRKLFFASRADMARVDGFGGGTKLAENVYAALARVRDKAQSDGGIDCATLMEASNAFGGGFGVKRLQAVLRAFPGAVAASSSPTVEELVDRVDGVQRTTAAAFLRGLDAFRAFQADHGIPCRELPAAADRREGKKGEREGGPTVVFSGVRDADLEKRIERDIGGKVSGSVSRNTSCVVVPDGGDSPSTGKTKKASELDVPVVSLSQFRRRYGLT